MKESKFNFPLFKRKIRIIPMRFALEDKSEDTNSSLFFHFFATFFFYSMSCQKENSFLRQ